MSLPTAQLRFAWKIKKVAKQIYAVIIPDKYHRAMTFCRVQEYYESPSPSIHGKRFSLWDYMNWYHRRYKKGFSYGHDWSGFNIPSAVAVECMQKNGMGKKARRFETPYDKVMHDILQKTGWQKNIYLVASAATKGSTFRHEVCHGLYHTDAAYRHRMDTLTNSLPAPIRQALTDRLKEMGYGKKVIKDEIQAYLQYGYDDESFLSPVERRHVEKTAGKPLKYYHQQYTKAH